MDIGGLCCRCVVGIVMVCYLLIFSNLSAAPTLPLSRKRRVIDARSIVQVPRPLRRNMSSISIMYNTVRRLDAS